MLAVDVGVAEAAWSLLPGVPDRIVETIGVAAREAAVPLAPEAEVSVLLCDDGTIRDLNRTWRAVDKPTNVLSFPAAPVGALAAARLLGDIVVAYGTVSREAAAEGKTTMDHATHLVVHGFLHLLGHDHEDPAQAATMEALEVRILARLGVADPYADPAPHDEASR